MTTLITRPDLAALFYGAADAALACEGAFHVFEGKRLGVRSMTVRAEDVREGEPQTKVKWRRKIRIDTPEDFEQGFGFTNLRLVTGHLDYLSLCCGGQMFDNVYPNITGETGLTMLNDGIVPALKLHPWEVSFSGVGEATIEYSVVKITNPVEHDQRADVRVCQTQQITSPETVVAGPNVIPLSVNHPVKRIEYWSTTPLSDVRIELDGGVILEFEPGSTAMEFEPTINFSRIENAVMRFTATEPGTVCVFAQNLQIARFLKGMGGLAYSK